MSQCPRGLRANTSARRLRTTNNLPADRQPFGQRRDLRDPQVETAANAQPLGHRDVCAAQIEIVEVASRNVQPRGEILVSGRSWWKICSAQSAGEMAAGIKMRHARNEQSTSFMALQADLSPT
jgi:hypothetical protein